MTQHVVLFRETAFAAFEGAFEVFSVLVARGNVLGEVTLV